MSSDRDVTRIVRSWLQEGATQLPDRVLDVVIDQLPATPQRRPWWSARRMFHMTSNATRLGLAAAGIAAVAVLAVIIWAGFFGTSNVGGPGPTEIPSPTPDPGLGRGPSEAPVPETETRLEAGRYVTRPFGADSPAIIFTLPDGWRNALSDLGFTPSAAPRQDAPDGMGIVFNQPTGLYSDPCDSSGEADVPVGPSVEDLASALTEQTAYEVTAPTDVTLGGYAGKRVDIQLPEDAACPLNEYFIWDGPGGVYAQGPSNRWHVWIIDVGGERVVVSSLDYASTSAEDQAELQAIIDSITFEP